MIKKHTAFAFVLLLLGVCQTAIAQTLDLFNGDTAVSCPVSQNPNAPGYSVSGASCSQLGTQVTCTLPAGQGANFSKLQAIKISNSGTAIDTTFNAVSAMWGEDTITNITGDTITLTSPATATVSAVTAVFADGHAYVPEDASGNVLTVAVPGQGNRRIVCTPQNHYFFALGVSNVCSSLVNGNCSFGAAITSSVNTTRAANVATLTVNIASASVRFFNQGQSVSITNCANTAYNSTPTKIINLSGTMVITYANVGPDDPAGTTGCKLQAFGWNPAKYTTFAGTQPDPRCNSELGEVARYVAMGFTLGTGEVSDGYAADPTASGACNVGASNGGTRWYPEFTQQTTPAASRYPGVNLWGCSTQPVKIPYYTVQPNIVGKNTTLVLLDWAEPEWTQWTNCNWNPSTGHNPIKLAETPGMFAIVFDDSDNMSQTRSAGAIPSVGLGVPVPDPAIITLYSAPQISISNKALYTNGIWTTPLVFADPCNYSKDLATECGLSAPTVCNSTQPCSLADFLRIKYTTVGALNAVWNTSYTTFGSARTQHLAEAHALTDTALTNSGVIKRSVQITITPSGGSGLIVTGDCTFGMTDCPTGTAGQGTFLAPPPCFNGGSANFYLTTGIICTDPNGDIEQVTNTVGGGSTATAVPSWPLNTNCSGTQTTVSNNVTFTCRGPKITGTITYSTGAIALTAGGAGVLPTGEVLKVNYSTGSGWDSGGTCSNCIGVEDDDGLGGRGGISFVNGVNPVCPQPYTTGIVVTAYQTEVSFVSGGANFWAMATSSGTTSDPAPAFTTNPTDLVTGSDGIHWEIIGPPTSDASNGVNFKNACGVYNLANATIFADLESWDEQFFDFYFKNLHTVTSLYHVLDFGVNFGLGSYNSPTWIGGLKAANQYTDGAFVGTQSYFAAPTIAPLSKLSIDYETNYFKHPIFIEPFLGSCAGDWQGQIKSCTNSQTNFNGLVARANVWYNIISGMLAYQSPDGARPWNGAMWWPDHANDQGGGSFALIDFNDNRIDGVENVTAVVPCDPPLSSLSCGGELSTVPWNGINEETCSHCIVPANALPYGAPPVAAPTPLLNRHHAIIWATVESQIKQTVGNQK